MIHSKNTLLILMTASLISFSSCKNEGSHKQSPSLEKKSADIINHSKIDSLKPQELYHYSAAKNQKFDHPVKGLDENGKNVNGIINLEDEIAIGVLKGPDNNDIEIISDQINANKIIATDINGFQYKLEME